MHIISIIEIFYRLNQDYAVNIFRQYSTIVVNIFLIIIVKLYSRKDALI